MAETTSVIISAKQGPAGPPGSSGGSGQLATVTDPAVDAALTTATIDTFDGIVLTFTTEANSQTLGPPTDTTPGREFTILNSVSSTAPAIVRRVGEQEFFIEPGNMAIFKWDGAYWSAEVSMTRFSTFSDPGVDEAFTTAVVDSSDIVYVKTFNTTGTQTIQPPTHAEVPKFLTASNEGVSSDILMVNGHAIKPGHYITFLWDNFIWTVPAEPTGAEIKVAYEGEANTNAFTDTEKTKLAGIEGGAEVNPTPAEIKADYESNADTNEYSDAEQTKLGDLQPNLPTTAVTDPAEDAAVTTAIIDANDGIVITIAEPYAPHDTVVPKQTLQPPTDTTAGKSFAVSVDSSSTVSVRVIGADEIIVEPGTKVNFLWDGAIWAASPASSPGLFSKIEIIQAGDITPNDDGKLFIIDHGEPGHTGDLDLPRIGIDVPDGFRVTFKIESLVMAVDVYPAIPDTLDDIPNSNPFAISGPGKYFTMIAKIGSPNNWHLLAGGERTMYAAVEKKTADFTITSGDEGKAFVVDSSGGDVTVSMDRINLDIFGGFKTSITKIASSNTVIITADVTDTIDGSSSYDLNSINDTAILMADVENDDWVVVPTIGPTGGYVSTAVDLLTSGQRRIGVTDTSAPRTITISTADISVINKAFTIKDASSGAGTNNILIDTEGSETIDGLSDISITVNSGVLRIYSDGTNLFTE